MLGVRGLARMFCYARGWLSAPASVAAGALVQPIVDRVGRLFVEDCHPNIQTYCLETNSAQTNTVIATAGTGKKIRLFQFRITVGGDCTNKPSFKLYVGDTGAWTQVDGHTAIPAGVPYGVDDKLLTASSKKVSYSTSAPTGGSVTITARYAEVDD